MRFITIVFAAVFALAASLNGSLVPENSAMNEQSDEVQRANALWDLAISAKGGREKLHSVRSLVVSSRSRNLGGPKDIPGDHTVSLFVLPDKLWQWIDSRPGAFGLNISVLDFGRAVGWELSDRWDSARPITTKPSQFNPSDPAYDSKADSKYRSIRERFLEDQLVYLMETKFLKPTLVGARKAKVGSRKVDVIEGVVDRERVEFYLDPKSHLPLRIVFITRLESGRDFVDVIHLADYAEVGGIQMPHRVSWASDEDNRTTYQINVDYDPAIFERPPRTDMGPEAWKPSKK